jgi:hypothetical protein
MRCQPAYPDKQETVSSATTRLTMLLLNATDEAFARLTVDGLVATHRVPRRVVEEQFEAAKARRARG